MRAGTLRHRLAFDRPDHIQNDVGEEEEVWHHQGTVWARIQPLTGRELLLSNANLSQFDTRIIIRWAPSLDSLSPKWRARNLQNGVIYNIKSITQDDMGHRSIEILAQSGTNAG